MKKTKKQKIKDHLISHGSITSMQAITEYWVTRLAAVIFILKKEGWEFEVQDVPHKDGGHYARYILNYSPEGDGPWLSGR